MKKSAIFYILSLLMVTLMLPSCSDNDSTTSSEIPNEIAEKTVFVYMPWTGNLSSFLQQNITDMKAGIIKNGGLGNKQLIIYFATSATHGSLFRVKYENGKCIDDTIRSYENTEARGLAMNSATWIKYIANQVQSYAPANIYSMIIGGHGYGWITGADYDSITSTNKAKGEVFFNDSEVPITRTDSRWFGGLAIKTDVATLAKGLSDAGIKMQYILFDNCYMSNMETVYDLRNNADHIIACPTEIMAYGMPYESMWAQLSATAPDYNAICNEFYDFYNSYNRPYGTIAVTDCSEIDNMAKIMKDVYAKKTISECNTDSIQNLDGFNPPIFFDFGDYVNYICKDSAALLNKFNEEISRLVPYKAHTESYFTELSRYGTQENKKYSGLTISDPSTNVLTSKKNATAFYKATH